jgi:hypothetical protein
MVELGGAAEKVRGATLPSGFLFLPFSLSVKFFFPASSPC